MTPHIPVSQAISQFLIDHNPPKWSRSYHARLRFRLLEFPRQVGDLYLDEIAPLHVNTWTHSNQPRLNIIAYRRFANWCNDKLGATLYIPPTTSARDERDYLAQPPGAKARQYREEARRIAALMHLPYQRAIFLLGFLFGWGLRKMLTVTMAEVRDLPIRTELVEALEAMKGIYPMQGAIFAPWLGQHYRTALRRWENWVGKSLPFASVLKDGNRARFEAGIRPMQAGAQVRRFVEAMPLLDQENIRRIEVPRLGKGAE